MGPIANFVDIMSVHPVDSLSGIFSVIFSNEIDYFATPWREKILQTVSNRKG